MESTQFIAFRNGVYVVNDNVFTPSVILPVEYTNFNDEDKEVKEIRDFLEKVFPDILVRKKFLDFSCNVLTGKNRKVSFWTGKGNNGKSITRLLFKKMLGQQAIELPSSLISGKYETFPEWTSISKDTRWVCFEEPEEDISVPFLKELAGSDRITVRNLYEPAREISPMFFTTVICNNLTNIQHIQDIPDNTINIPFESTFTDNAPETLEEQLSQKCFPSDRQFHKKIVNMVDAFVWVLLKHMNNK